MKKIFKKSIAILFCITMVLNYSFTLLAEENVEGSESETTYTETIEATENSDTIESIEEEIDDDVEEETLDDSSEEIIEPEDDLSEEDEDILDEKEEENVASPSEIIDEEGGEEEGILADMVEEPEEEMIFDEIISEEIEEATPSDVEEIIDEEIIDEEIIDEATPSVIEEIIDEKCEIIVYFLTDMKLKDKGNGGSYNYSWDTFIVDKNQEFNIDEKMPEVIKHSSCEQEYTLVGFTTENQIDNIWKGADYAGGVSTLDKNFMVDNDMVIFAVYEARDTYISSITIDNEVTYKTTTIPNKAIKNIFISDNNDDIYTKNENVKYYKIKNNLNDINYMFTKDSSEGKPIKVEGFSLEHYKK